MKNFGKLMLGTLLVVGTTACENDMLDNQQDLSISLEGKNIITAQVPGAGSRVEFDASGSNIQVKWKESGEMFSLYTNNPNFDDSQPVEGPHNLPFKNYTYTQVSGNKFAGNATLVVGNTIFAYYPCVGEYWNFMNAVPFVLSGQTGELNSDLTYMYISKVDVDNVDVLQFEHLTSIMKATFKFEENDVTKNIKRLRIFLPDGVYTNCYVNLTVDPIVYTEPFYSNEINITTENELDQFYIYLPFGIEKGQDISFMAYDEDTYYTGSLKAAKDIELGKIYPIDVKLTSQGTYLWKPGTTASTSVAGEGSSADPYLIKTANDLQWMINDAATYDGKHYKLDGDLTIQTTDANPWMPIGNANKPFNGVFDGNNKAIEGTLTAGGVASVDARSLPNDAGVFGFFGYIGTAGKVNNLFINTEVKGGMAGETYTGAVAGYNEGKISGSRSNKSVVGGNSTTGVSYTGGVVGYNAGIIENSTGSGLVTGSENTKTIGYTGGVAGYNAGTMSGNSAYGTITAAKAEQETIVGGIVGYNASNASVSSCETSWTTVTGNEAPVNLVGGVVGGNHGTITDSNSSYLISGPETNGIVTSYVGGIVAKNNAGGIVSNSGCYNGATIKGGRANTLYVGGYVAYNVNGGKLQNLSCYDGTITGGTGVIASYTGGAVAYNDGTFSESQIHYKTTGGSASNGTSYTGAAVGYNDINGKMYEVYTQMGSSITAGTGTAAYTGVFAGNNAGIIYPCCYEGGSLKNDDMPLVGSGNAVDEENCNCPLHSQQNNQ